MSPNRYCPETTGALASANSLFRAAGDGFHAHRDPGTNIHGQAIPPVSHQTERHRLGDVGYMHKIPAFLTILEEGDQFALAYPIGEDRQDAGVGVMERLAFSINILQTKNQEGNAQCAGCDPDQIFLG